METDSDGGHELLRTQHGGHVNKLQDRYEILASYFPE